MLSDLLLSNEWYGSQGRCSGRLRPLHHPPTTRHCGLHLHTRLCDRWYSRFPTLSSRLTALQTDRLVMDCRGSRGSPTNLMSCHFTLTTARQKNHKLQLSLTQVRAAGHCSIRRAAGPHLMA
jgi:hypothetical protein